MRSPLRGAVQQGNETWRMAKTEMVSLSVAFVNSSELVSLYARERIKLKTSLRH